jgi:hypothetical protein
MRQNKYPSGWDEDRVRRVMAHYEQQSEEEAVAEDEAASEDKGVAVVEIPKELVPTGRELIVQWEEKKKASRSHVRRRRGPKPIRVTVIPPEKAASARGDVESAQAQ